MIPRVHPALDPLAQRSAIQALETQRAAYARFAHRMDVHRTAVAGGSGEAAATAAAAAADGHRLLAEGAARTGEMVAAARAGGSPEEREELQRQVDAMLEQARAADAAIHNLTQQLEAWHAAYSRQLAEVGIEAGGAPAVGGAPAGDAGAGAGKPAGSGGFGYAGVGYGPRGRAGERGGLPSVLDRMG